MGFLCLRAKGTQEEVVETATKYSMGSSDDKKGSHDNGCVEESRPKPAEDGDGVTESKKICTRRSGIQWIWSHLKDVVLRNNDEDAHCEEDAAVGNNLKQKRAYTSYTYEKYGFMAKLGRVVLLIFICVMAIREMWPDKYGSYMGFDQE